MSKSIDTKVVEMRFDNQQFEKNVATTLNSLDKLEKSLDMKGASKGLESIESAARKCDMSGMSNALDGVKMKFSALEVAGMTVIQNLTNSAINYGKRIVSALTIDPVTAGFNEYELKMGSIQTIMASTGEDLETVNQYLGELNEYSDKTIYSFQDMTSNIGKFTNAGVNLKDSVAAIQGISNVAAVSGANAGEASRAMYNFSQALSSGYVKLIDWKSIENANMATVEFKEQLIESAVAAGTLTKTADGMYKTVDGKVISATKNFNDSLQDQWMTSEVLINTLGKYSDESTEIGKKAAAAATEVKTLSQLYDTLKESAQSGWAQTWEIIVGDFEEAKEFLSYLNNLIGDWIGNQAEARNDMLENWKILGGRTALIDSLKNMVEGLGSIIKPISEAFKEIFPPMTAERLMGLTEGLKNLTARLKISDETADNIKRTFKGLFAILDIGRQIFVAVINVIGKLLSPVGSLGGGIFSITAGIGDMLVALRDFIERSNILNGVFSLLGSVIGWVIGLVGDVSSFIGEAFSSGPIRAIVNFLNNLKISVTETFDSIGSAVEGSTFFTIIKAIGEALMTIGGIILNTVGKAFTTLFGSFEEGGFMNFINALISGGIGVAIIKLIKSIAGIFETVGSLKDSINELFGGITDTFKSFTNVINANALKTIAGAIIKLVLALLILTLIDQEKLAEALATLTMLFAELTASMMLMNGFKANALARSMTGLATALLIMVIPLKILSNMSFDQMTTGLIGLTGMLAILISAMKLMTKIDVDEGNAILDQAKVMRKIAWTLLLLCAPLAIIGHMEWIEIARGLTGMTGMLAILLVSLFTMSKIKTNGVLKHIELLRKIAFALMLLCIPLAIVGHMEWIEIARGLTGMTGMLAILLVSLFTMSKIKTNGVLKHIELLRKIAFALILLCIPLKVVGNMQWVEMARGFVGLVGLMATMIGMLKMLSMVPLDGVLDSIKILKSIAIALTLLCIPLAIVGNMEWATIGRGLGGLAAMIAGLILTLNALRKIPFEGILSNVRSLMTLALALVMLCAPLAIVGNMEWQTIWRGIAGLGVVLAGLIVSLGLITAISNYSQGGLASAVGAIVAIAGAIMILVPSLILLSLVPIISLVKAVLTIAAAFAVLGLTAKILAPLAPVIMQLSALMLALGAGILLAGLGVTAFAIGLGILAGTIVAFGAACEALIVSLGAIAAVLVTMVSSIVAGIILGIGKGIVALIETITNSISAICNLIRTIIIEICNVIIDCIPKIVETILEVVTQLLESLVEYIPRIAAALGKIILMLLDKLAELIGPIIDKLVQIIIKVLEGIARGIAPIVEAVLDVLMALIKGVIKGIANLDMSELWKALLNVGQLAAILAVLAGVSLLVPAAMAGVIGLGIVVAELAVVLAAFGALAQIPGLEWLITEGGNLLEAIGTAIGQFVGGIVGGIGKGISSALPDIASDFSRFMDNLQPFIDGARLIDETVLNGVRNLTKMILLITGAEVVEALGGWLVGGSSVEKFAHEIVILGEGLAGFANAVSGVDMTAVQDGTKAARSLANMADAIPNSGGLITLFTGDNWISQFAAEIPLLGLGLKGFANAVTGINIAEVESATEAAKRIAEMADAIPNSGGLVTLFTGDNWISQFAAEIPLLGLGLKGFANNVSGINAEEVKAAASAAESIARMCDTIPNSGGIVTWFAGDNSISKFSSEIIQLGWGLKGFGLAVSGVNPDEIRAAASAAEALAVMTDTIPNTGGVVSWFTGDNALANFATDIVALGRGLKGFSDATSGINPEQVNAAATSAKYLAEMTATLPDEDGVVSWFAGEKNLAGFSTEIVNLGRGLKGFSDAVTGINPDQVSAAATSAKTLAEMTATLPDEGGIGAWFTGEASVTSFASDLPKLGNGLKGFSDAVAGINPEAVTSAANSAKALADMTSVLPEEGGIKAWFSGETDISKWADKLPTLGSAMKKFSDSVTGVNPENITAGANAAKTLGELTEIVGLDSGVLLGEFGKGVEKFGVSLQKFFNSTKGIGAGAADSITKVIDSIKGATGIDGDGINNAAKAIEKLTKAIKGTEGVSADSTSGFVASIKKLGSVTVDNFTKAFDDIAKKMKKIAKTAVDAFADGISDNKKTVKSAGTDLAKACADAASEATDSFSAAGSNLVDGFAAGISENSYKAEAKARAMAKAAAEAAEDELDINSPSKVFRAIGTSVPEGFAQGIGRLGTVVDASVAGMSDGAVNGLKRSLAHIADIVNSDMDADPVICPVLDLTDVETGMRRLGNMVNIGSSVRLATNVGAISTRMSARSQNESGTAGTNTNNVTYNTYNVDGITYDDGTNIALAVEELVHAVKVERRT